MTHKQADRWGRALGAAAMIVAAIAFWGAVLVFVSRTALTVDPIARVSLKTDEASQKYADLAQPISKISMIATQSSPPPLKGWADDVKNLCNATPPPYGKETILLTQRGTGFFAVKADLTKEVCESFHHQSAGNRSVWAITDSKETEGSQPAIVILTQEPEPDWLWRRQN